MFSFTKKAAIWGEKLNRIKSSEIRHRQRDFFSLSARCATLISIADSPDPQQREEKNIQSEGMSATVPRSVVFDRSTRVEVFSIRTWRSEEKKSVLASSFAQSPREDRKKKRKKKIRKKFLK